MKKKCVLNIWNTEGYYEIRGEKTHGRDELYVQGGGGGEGGDGVWGGGVTDCKSKYLGETSLIKNTGVF